MRTFLAIAFFPLALWATTEDCSLLLSEDNPFAKLTPDDTKRGLLTESIPMTPENLILAYKQGAFPWKADDHSASWYTPPKRGVLFLEKFHIGRSSRRALKKANFTVTFNKDFEGVIRGCAEAIRPNQEETWISETFIKNYIELHKMGIAHSVETWNSKGELVGGTYGVYVDGVFHGESAFYKESNASKLADIHLVQKLIETGHTWMDLQMVTNHSAAIGGEYISRDEFKRLKLETKKRGLSFNP